MVKIEPKINDTNNRIYNIPVIGPVIALINGICLKVMFFGALKIVQSVPVGIAKLFDIKNVTEVNYDAVIVSGLELASKQGIGGIKDQISQAYHYFTDVPACEITEQEPLGTSTNPDDL